MARLAGMLLISMSCQAQTAEDLETQYRSVCSAQQQSALPDMRDMCSRLREQLDQAKRALTDRPARPAAASGKAIDWTDGTSQCRCTRKAGTCSAAARITKKEVTPNGNGGLSSLVVVRTEPPAGQCVEVTVFLQETAQFPTGPNRRGHPLYQVIRGANDTEWRNVGTSASKLDYSILSGETQCHVCEEADGGSTAEKAAADGLLTGRKSMEIQLRDCLSGRAHPYNMMDAASRRQVCEGLRQALADMPR